MDPLRDRVVPLVVVTLLTGATAACDGRPTRPGERLTTSDVAPAPSPKETTCVVPATDADPSAPRVWKVRRGDSLRTIAKRAYGDERFWTEIAAQNPRAVDRNGALREGAELVLPANVR